MNILNNIKFIKTDDNSTGLYSEEYKDIFHSKTGALKEALEKFLQPLNNINLNDEIKVLDICYGTGYNSKVLLNNYSAKKITIDALEYNKEFIFLSPLINDCIDDYELKIFLIEQILLNFKNINQYKEILGYIAYNNLYSFFDPAVMLFIEHLLSYPYKYISEDNLSSFLHNI